MPADDSTYDEDFFDAIHGESYASALAVVPRVMGLTGARSVVDVGSGSGAWSRVCREVGVPEVVGVDSASAPDRFREHHTEFIEHDLAEPLRLERQFGLAICVEVAEHVPPERAPGLVADLTALAPVVLFSAAVPGQGGTGHLNEQWSEYWVALFEAEGWACRDAIRPWVKSSPALIWGCHISSSEARLRTRSYSAARFGSPSRKARYFAMSGSGALSPPFETVTPVSASKGAALRLP